MLRDEKAWIAQARLEEDGSLAFKEGIEVLENLLASSIPKETALLANYRTRLTQRHGYRISWRSRQR